MEIIKEKEWLERFPMISQFQEAYRFPGIMAFTALAEGGETADPDRTALLLLRLFIETSEKVKKDQKYVIGLRFYSFGDMATADLISLDFPFHQDIAFEHGKRLGWAMSLGWEMPRGWEVSKVDKFQASYAIPLLFSGGHLEVTAPGEIIFSGESGDYGGNMLGLGINEIARALAHLCGVSVQGDAVKGQAFFGGILEFIQKNKLRNDFYERFVECNISHKLTGQHLSSLVMMKAVDRATKEGENFLQALVQEISGEHGLAKMMLQIGLERPDQRADRK